MNKRATFAGGCFWCLQPSFDEQPGVCRTAVGYMGGHVKDPAYDDVCSGRTGHFEVIQVEYDPDEVPYTQLLRIFWAKIDPTQEDGQFADRGSQYQTAIFYHDEQQRLDAERSRKILDESGIFHKPVATRIVAATEFYPAEDYHQNYYQKNSGHYQAYYQGSGRAAFCLANTKVVSALDGLEKDR